MRRCAAARRRAECPARRLAPRGTPDGLPRHRGRRRPFPCRRVRPGRPDRGPWAPQRWRNRLLPDPGSGGRRASAGDERCAARTRRPSDGRHGWRVLPSRRPRRMGTRDRRDRRPVADGGFAAAPPTTRHETAQPTGSPVTGSPLPEIPRFTSGPAADRRSWADATPSGRGAAEHWDRLVDPLPIDLEPLPAPQSGWTDDRSGASNGRLGTASDPNTADSTARWSAGCGRVHQRRDGTAVARRGPAPRSGRRRLGRRRLHAAGGPPTCSSGGTTPTEPATALRPSGGRRTCSAVGTAATPSAGRRRRRGRRPEPLRGRQRRRSGGERSGNGREDTDQAGYGTQATRWRAADLLAGSGPAVGDRTRRRRSTEPSGGRRRTGMPSLVVGLRPPTTGHGGGATRWRAADLLDGAVRRLDADRTLFPAAQQAAGLRHGRDHADSSGTSAGSPWRAAELLDGRGSSDTTTAEPQRRVADLPYGRGDSSNATTDTPSPRRRVADRLEGRNGDAEAGGDSRWRAASLLAGRGDPGALSPPQRNRGRPATRTIARPAATPSATTRPSPNGGPPICSTGNGETGRAPAPVVVPVRRTRTCHGGCVRPVARRPGRTTPARRVDRRPTRRQAIYLDTAGNPTRSERRRHPIPPRWREPARRIAITGATQAMGVAEGTDAASSEPSAGPPAPAAALPGRRPTSSTRASTRAAGADPGSPHARRTHPRTHRRIHRRRGESALPSVTRQALRHPDVARSQGQYRGPPEHLGIGAERRQSGRHQRRPGQRRVPALRHAQWVHRVVHHGRDADGQLEPAELHLRGGGLVGRRLQRGRQA